MNITLKSASMTEAVEIPDKNFLGIFEPPQLPSPPADKDSLIRSAIENPESCPELEKLITPSAKVSIVVDDISRPTPSKDILNILIDKLFKLGVNKENILITVANGLHRKTIDDEKLKIVGEKVYDAFDIQDNNAREKDCFRYIGTTTSDTPVYINKRVADADVIITIGMIKSHGIAGFTGGAKSILPGVSAKETILANHRFDFVEYPKGIVGDADKSFMRQDIEEAAKMLKKPLFIINVVLDSQHDTRGVYAGDVIKAHRKGVEHFRKIAQVHLPEQADMVVIEANYPSSENLYFALAGLATVMSAKKPAVKSNGSIVMFAQCTSGIGADIIENLFNHFDSPDKLREHLRTNAPVEQQWAAQRLAYYVKDKEIGIVTQGINEHQAKSLNMIYYPKLQDAIDKSIDSLGSSASILIVRNADFLLLNIE